MKRTIVWIAAGAGVLAVLAGGVFVAIESSRTRTLGGPIAIVQGNPPKHGFLGVEFQREPSASPTVTHVVPGTGAAQAGIQPGDVIESIDDQSSPTFEDVRRFVENSQPNSLVRITIRREDVKHQLDVRLTGFAELVLLQEQDRTNRNRPEGHSESPFQP